MAESYDLDRLDSMGNGNHAYQNYAFYPNEDDNNNNSMAVANISPKMESSEIAVQIRNVTLSYGRHKVLDGINMNVPVKKIYGLLGPSGCGPLHLSILRGHFHWSIIIH